jgi:hypothetical protein
MMVGMIEVGLRRQGTSVLNTTSCFGGPGIGSLTGGRMIGTLTHEGKCRIRGNFKGRGFAIAQMARDAHQVTDGLH